MGEVKNGFRGVVRIGGLGDIAAGVQQPSDAEAADGATRVVAFALPDGTRRIAPGDVVTLDGLSMRVISYGPSAFRNGLMVMKLGAAG